MDRTPNSGGNDVRRRQAIKILDTMAVLDHKAMTIERAMRKFTGGKANTVRVKRIIRRRTWIPLRKTAISDNLEKSSESS